MKEQTELEKAVAFEAIRDRLPDVWTLLDISESANPSEYSDNDPDLTLPARDGWSVSFFYDCGELDYIDHITTPDGLSTCPWDWPAGAPGQQDLMNWRSMGDRARLMAMRDRYPERIIDCTTLQGDLVVDEQERDKLVFGRIELLGGYLDWDASVVRRTPVPAKEAA